MARVQHTAGAGVQAMCAGALEPPPLLIGWPDFCSSLPIPGTPALVPAPRPGSQEPWCLQPHRLRASCHWVSLGEAWCLLMAHCQALDSLWVSRCHRPAPVPLCPHHSLRPWPALPALIRYIRPVFVSRSDQDSRRKTVEEIRRRAQSAGKWPQVMPPAWALMGLPGHVSKGTLPGCWALLRLSW